MHVLKRIATIVVRSSRPAGMEPSEGAASTIGAEDDEFLEGTTYVEHPDNHPLSSYRTGQAFRERLSRLQWTMMQRSPNTQIVTALDYISGRLARDEKALELAYDVIKLLETDGLVYTKKVMVVCVC